MCMYVRECTMKQSSLFSFVSNGGLAPSTDVVDLFCGIGGFSCGTTMGGHRVVLAVDNNKDLLNCHKKNHPECRHVCCELPSSSLPLPTSGKWHLHGSPPCTKLSVMRQTRPREEQEDTAVEREEAMGLVDWFLSLALSSGSSSWTMEQVAHKAVIEHLDDLKRRHPLKADWIVVDATDYEVPQHRKRIIAGSPFLIANLRFFRSSRKRKLCIRDAIPDPPREFVRNALYKRLDPQTGENVDVPLRNKLRSVDKPSFTILATGHIKWADKDANVLRLLTARERSLLQSFPSDYVLPRRSADALVGVGNAVPPRLAQILMSPTRSS